MIKTISLVLYFITFVLSLMYTQTQDKEPKDLRKDGKVKTQRAAPQGSGKTKATEENEQVSLSDQMKFDCFIVV